MSDDRDDEDEASEYAEFWATPIAEMRGKPPWIDEHQYFENLLVRASVARIKEALLAHPDIRPASPEAAAEQALDNTPVRTRQFHNTRLAVPQPQAQALTFARLQGHDWTQIRGGHRLEVQRILSNEWLAQFLSKTLDTTAFVYGYEDTSAISYHFLYSRGELVKSLSDEEEIEDREEVEEALFREEELFDPDAYWEVDTENPEPGGSPVLRLEPNFMDEGSRGFQREDFAEADFLVVEAIHTAE